MEHVTFENIASDLSVLEKYLNYRVYYDKEQELWHLIDYTNNLHYIGDFISSVVDQCLCYVRGNYEL